MTEDPTKKRNIKAKGGTPWRVSKGGTFQDLGKVWVKVWIKKNITDP